MIISKTSATSIIIPVLNEEKNFIKLVNQINYFLKKFKYEIIFIDDNSTDNSHKILQNLKKRYKIVSFHIRKNKKRDLSQSCILGFEKAKFNNVLVMDGDLQHNPKYLPMMIKSFNKKNLDFLVSSRNFKSPKNEGLSFIRFYASKIIIFIFFILVGKKTIDPMSGFFIFKKKIYERNKDKLFGEGYKILSDLIYCNSTNYKIKDLIIKFETRKKGKSKMSFKILFQLLKFIILTFIKRLRF